MNALDIITKATREIAALPEFKEKSQTLDTLSKLACTLILAQPEILEIEDEDEPFRGGMENPFNG